MGLDSHELVLDVEKAFGIKVDDKDATMIETIGDFTDYVITRVRAGKNTPCLSQARFYRLRAVLTETLGVPRERIRLETPLAELLGADLRNNWKKLKAALDSPHFPSLKTTMAFFAVVNCGIPVAIAILAGWMSASFALVVFPFTLLWSIFAVGRVTENMGTCMPAGFDTVESLLPCVDLHTGEWTREAVLEQIILFSSEITGIPMKEIGEHSRFIDDLGMG